MCAFYGTLLEKEIVMQHRSRIYTCCGCWNYGGRNREVFHLEVQVLLA